jgi:hypothetical protein
LDLDLVTVPDDVSQELSLDKPFSWTKTDADGNFLFESVSPGRYFLGSNIIGINSSSVPPTFYPGRRDRAAAVPIQIDLGQAVNDLLFTLPDFGVRREIRLCVVDEAGKAVAGAGIGSEPRLKEIREGATDQTGCLTAAGYSTLAYSVSASFRPPPAIFAIRNSPTTSSSSLARSQC